MKSILDVTKTVFGFFIFPIFVLFVHVFLRLFSNIYEIFPWFDIPMHFAGGFAVGYSYFLILNFLQEKNYLKISSILKVIFIFSCFFNCSVLGVFWVFCRVFNRIWFTRRFKWYYLGFNYGSFWRCIICYIFWSSILKDISNN